MGQCEETTPTEQRPIAMTLNRHQVTLHMSHTEADDGGYTPGTAEERFLEVWELTREVWAFFQEANAERRLQRDVVVLVRGGCWISPCRGMRRCRLIANKRATGRTQDQADVEQLRALSSEKKPT